LEQKFFQVYCIKDSTFIEGAILFDEKSQKLLNGNAKKIKFSKEMKAFQIVTI